MKRRVDTTVTLGDCIENFLMEKEATGRSSKTVDSYRYSLNQFSVANNFLEGEPVKNWDNKVVFKFIAMLRDKDMSMNSINHYLRDIRTFLYWCMEQGYLDRFKVDLVKGQEEPPKFFQQEEVKKLIKKPSKDAKFVEWRSYMMCMFVYATGARASTLVNLRVEDVDFKGKEITYTATKSKKSQVVPLSPKLAAALREYLRMWEVDTWLFPNRDGSKLTVNALKHAMARHCELRGVDKTSIHGLRHSFAREWVKGGGDVFKLQKMLGHSTLDMTKKYVRLFDSDLKDGFVSPLDKI